jgi:hypothetical protein
MESLGKEKRMAQAAWQKDAKQFGRRFKFGEWESALWVARSVQKGEGGGVSNAARDAAVRAGKVLTSEFAEAAGVGVRTVQTYMRTWEAAAKVGIVSYPQTLSPGEDVELPDPALWKKYYDIANPRVEDAAATPILSERWEKWFQQIGNLMIDGARLADETEDTGEALEGPAEVARFFYDRLSERQLDAEWRQLSETVTTES